MTTRVLISLFCDDRPGVVEDLSSALDLCGGNWLDSRLSRLGGQFAGVVEAQLPASEESALREQLALLNAKGITTTLCEASAHKGPPTQEQNKLRTLILLGPDRPGIVRELTRALVGARFNVQSLDTQVETAPMSGEPLFRARATIELLEGSRLDELEWKLDALSESMLLEIDLLPVNSPR